MAIKDLIPWNNRGREVGFQRSTAAPGIVRPLPLPQAAGIARGLDCDRMAQTVAAKQSPSSNLACRQQP